MLCSPALDRSISLASKKNGFKECRGTFDRPRAAIQPWAIFKISATKARCRSIPALQLVGAFESAHEEDASPCCRSLLEKSRGEGFRGAFAATGTQFA
jgi:hypothetical protein